MSVIAAALKHMLAAGMDHAAIVAAVADMEANAPKDVQAERRRQADKERKRLRKSAESADLVDAVSPKKETSPTPPKEKTTPSSEPNGSSKTRAVRIPVEFEPDLGWAVGAGMSHSQALTEAEQFRDYWTAKPGKDGTKLDWPATWRQWVRNQLKRRPASRASPPRQPNVADGFAALSREIENRNDPRPSPSDESPRRFISDLSGVQVG